MKSQMKTALLLSLFMSLLGDPLFAASAPNDGPRYTNEGHLIRPDDYREWIFLGAGLGMTYNESTASSKSERAPRFDNVFVNSSAYRSFLQNGTWPDKTVFILEIRASGTSASINKGGHYQEGVVRVEAHVKDEARFPNKWAFFDLEVSAPSGKPLPTNSSCQKCHAAHGAVDETFVQFYPTLIEIAKAKGTFRETGGK